LATTVVSWWAFRDARAEEGADLTVAFGLWIGAVSVLLMAWSFVLALRVRFLERFFGGLDGVYKTHRWAGTLAVLTMFLHTSVEPEVDGIAGAARSVAEQAEDLAGGGEIMIYALLAATFLRLLPYRWWRWTHKAFGVPYLLASWHFFTAEKPYANASAWGWWFGAWMVVGAVAWVWRLLVRDAGAGWVDYSVTDVEHHERITRLRLRPQGRELGHRAGQFAFCKLGVNGMSEPHPFTIASAPNRPDGELEFVIAHLGDWSDRLPELDLVGADVALEGPYGHFHPRPSDPTAPTLWVAGGVGLTPFLAALDQERHRPADATDRAVPTLLYCTRRADNDPLVPELAQAELDGLVRLEVFDRSTGRLTPADLDRLFPAGLDRHHVAICGPEALVADVGAAARVRGAARVETEDFDMRKGVGPERSREWRALLARFAPMVRDRRQLARS
jgi:predicted ferric reductase